MINYFFRIRVIVIIILINCNAYSQQTNDTTQKKKNNLFELSFGQSMLFISDSDLINIQNKSTVVVPTSSMLFFAEARPQKIIRIPVFFNIPTETKQFLVNNQLVNERASPTFGTGVQFRCFKIKIYDKSRLDFSIGPIASFLLLKKGAIQFLPIVAARARIMRGENFVMYIGTSYSFGINTWGLLYGTGTIF